MPAWVFRPTRKGTAIGAGSVPDSGTDPARRRFPPRWGTAGDRGRATRVAGHGYEFPPFDGSAPKQQEFKSPPAMGIDPSKRYTATLDTSLGEIVIALDAVKAPKTVNNFVFLALHHYYDGVIFHRIINGFMCQGGDPTGTGRGGPGYRFDDELPKAGAVPDRLGGHGQRRPEHERQPVLPRLRPSTASACRRSTACSARS